MYMLWVFKRIVYGPGAVELDIRCTKFEAILFVSETTRCGWVCPTVQRDTKFFPFSSEPNNVKNNGKMSCVISSRAYNPTAFWTDCWWIKLATLPCTSVSIYRMYRCPKQRIITTEKIKKNKWNNNLDSMSERVNLWPWRPSSGSLPVCTFFLPPETSILFNDVRFGSSTWHWVRLNGQLAVEHQSLGTKCYFHQLASNEQTAKIRPALAHGCNLPRFYSVSGGHFNLNVL